MNELLSTPLPAFLLFFGAALATVIRQDTLRNIIFIVTPLIAFAYIGTLNVGDAISFSFMPGFGDATPLKVTTMGKAFGFIFTLNAAIAFIYGWSIRKPVQNIWALLYIGAGLGVVFAGDLITLYVFWEMMAVTSTFVVLARQNDAARAAAFRYVMIHVFGGLLLLAGIVITIGATGSIDLQNFATLEGNDLGLWLMGLGVLVNCGAPPFSAWLSDTYPSGTVTGSLILSAYTTKTAVYVLLAGFAGWDPLLVFGPIAALYGGLFAMMENDLRKILAYALISQIGFMITGAGLGTPLAVAGATAHAFCCIIYISLLWMAASAILHRYGTCRLTDLGGLAKDMPWTTAFFIIGAATIAAFPLTNGFTSKTIILYAAEVEHQLLPWLALEIASAAVFLYIGLKATYYAFFAKPTKALPAARHEVDSPMITGMSLAAFLCLFLGIFPDALYSILPGEVGTYNAYKPAKLVSQLQLLTCVTIAFFLFRHHLAPKPGITLDSDWFYRRGIPKLTGWFDCGLNGFNALAHKTIVGKWISRLGRFTAAGPSKVLIWAMYPFWKSQGLDEFEIETAREKLYDRGRSGAFPIGVSACFSIVLLAILLAAIR